VSGLLWCSDDADRGGHEVSRPRCSGRSRRSVSGRNERGELPIHRAARRGDVKQTKKIIKDGADVNCRDYAGTAAAQLCRHSPVHCRPV